MSSIIRGFGVEMHHKREKKEEDSGGKMMRVFVAIAYGHGAVLCEEQFFPDFIREHFENAFKNSSNS